MSSRFGVCKTIGLTVVFSNNPLPSSINRTHSVYSRNLWGNIPPSKVYPPHKITFVSGKSQLLVQRKAFSFWGALSPDPLNWGSAHGPHWGNSPQTSSSGVNPLTSTTSGHPQFLAVCANVQKASASGGLLPPDPRNFAPGPHWRTSEVPIHQLP